MAERMRLEFEGRVLDVPSMEQWGIGEVFLDGVPIPSARLWKVWARYMEKGLPAPKAKLFDAARIAEIYQLQSAKFLVHTYAPKPNDQLLAGNVYVRTDKLRVRSLCSELKLITAKIEPPVDATSIKGLVDVCQEHLKVELVAAQEKRFYFSSDPEAVFERFGTRDHLRLAVYLKRPSSAGFEVRL